MVLLRNTDGCCRESLWPASRGVGSSHVAAVLHKLRGYLAAADPTPCRSQLRRDAEPPGPQQPTVRSVYLRRMKVAETAAGLVSPRQ